MTKVRIRSVKESDVLELQDLARRTFFETFSSVNTEKNMKQYLEENLSVEKLRSELGNEDSRFYFALEEEKVIGYLKVNFGKSQTESRYENSLEIERIYVLKEYHGKNVGQQLYDKAIEIAKGNSLEFVWLGVWEKNLRAINFYKKNGFVEFDKHIFKLGEDEQTDLMMKLNLNFDG